MLYVPPERASKHMEELLAKAGNLKGPIENKPGDNAILRVIEAYCASGGRGAIRKSPPPIVAMVLKSTVCACMCMHLHACVSIYVHVHVVQGLKLVCVHVP